MSFALVICLFTIAFYKTENPLTRKGKKVISSPMKLLVFIMVNLLLKNQHQDTFHLIPK